MSAFFPLRPKLLCELYRGGDTFHGNFTGANKPEKKDLGIYIAIAIQERAGHEVPLDVSVDF